MKSIWNLVKSNQIPGIYSNLMKSHGPEHLIPGLAWPPCRPDKRICDMGGAQAWPCHPDERICDMGRALGCHVANPFVGRHGQAWPGHVETGSRNNVASTSMLHF